MNTCKINNKSWNEKLNNNEFDATDHWQAQITDYNPLSELAYLSVKSLLDGEVKMKAKKSGTNCGKVSNDQIKQNIVNLYPYNYFYWSNNIYV